MSAHCSSKLGIGVQEVAFHPGYHAPVVKTTTSAVLGVMGVDSGVKLRPLELKLFSKAIVDVIVVVFRGNCLTNVPEIYFNFLAI